MKRYESFMYLTKLNLHQDSFSKRNKPKLTILTKNVRTGFALDPKQDWVLAQQAQTINL